MARPRTFTFPAADRDGICTAQQTAGATTLTINGAYLDLGLTTANVRQASFAGIQRVVTVYSAGNIATVIFTIAGYNLRGAAVSDTVTGVNNSTVATTAEFAVVTSITTSAAVGSDVEVGTGSTGVTNWYQTNVFANPANITVALGITATASVTVQDTPDDANAAAPTNVFNHPVLAAVTSSAESNYAFPPRFVRAVMNSSSGNGAFTFTIIQAG